MAFLLYKQLILYSVDCYSFQHGIPLTNTHTTWYTFDVKHGIPKDGSPSGGNMCVSVCKQPLHNSQVQ